MKKRGFILTCVICLTIFNIIGVIDVFAEEDYDYSQPSETEENYNDQDLQQNEDSYDQDDESGYSSDQEDENVYDDYTDNDSMPDDGSIENSVYEENDDNNTTEDFPENKSADTSWFDPENQKKSYVISTEEELIGLSKLVNTRKMEWLVNEVYTFKGITISLKNDIELTSDWTPIGNSDTHVFEGTFEGNGHTISNVTIKDAATSNIGLFGYVRGIVQNLNVKGKISSAGNNIGGIAGFVDEKATIQNCTSAVNVSGTSKVGGIAGTNNKGTVLNCHASGNVKGVEKIGGVVGENWGGTIENCSNKGTITSTGRGVGTFGTGGVVGRSVASSAAVKNSCNFGTIQSNNECAGGVVGYANAQGSSIENCYNSGDLSGTKSKKLYGYVGGIVGSIGDGVVLENSYNAGSLKSALYIGGVVGDYATGFSGDITAYISNNYYVDDSNVTGVGLESASKGGNYANSIEPKSAAELRSSQMASTLGVAFTPDISGMYGQNKGFPILSWQGDSLIEKDEIIDKMKISYKDNFKKLYNKYPFGITKGRYIIEILNPKLMFERVIEEIESEDSRTL